MKLGGNMEILKTIPIYGVPDWVGILFLSSIILGIIALILKDTEYVGLIMGLIAAIGILLASISAVIFNRAEFKHNEYVVRITNMPAQEFIEKYEVVKHFDYSDVIQIKEIEKK